MRCGFGVWWCSGGDVAWVMGCRFCLVVVVVVCVCFFSSLGGGVVFVASVWWFLAICLCVCVFCWW